MWLKLIICTMAEKKTASYFKCECSHATDPVYKLQQTGAQSLSAMGKLAKDSTRILGPLI